ncbi:MAG TPA: xanthine dehydrogenase family protein molybdopterin-binding subunit, partial [Acetobacteraceae bacterium]|nr:xanthine dehydrogenase family protein molybdopterin-binding subunit [Acetobacteraceae bacterium]
GVLAVLTGADLAADGVGGIPCGWGITGKDGLPMKEPAHPALAQGKVRHVGDPVAFVVAETPALAKQAAEAVVVDYDTLPAVVGVLDAIRPGAPLLFDDIPENLCCDWELGDRAATDAAFETAAHVARISLVNNRLAGNPMEPRAAIAEFDRATGRTTLWTTSQFPHVVRLLMGNFVLKIPQHKLRVVAPDVGGGFGVKQFHYAEEAVVTWAARRVNRPIKWVSDRSEGFVSDAQGRDHVSEAELALDETGKFLALRVRTLANMGGYLSTFGPNIPTNLYAPLLAGVYTTPAIYCEVKVLFTNTVPVDAYRGAGRPEANYLVERLVDAAARELKIDRAELRRRNMVPPSAMPHATPVGKTYDSGDFRKVFDIALDKVDYAGFAGRRADAAKRGKRRGIGFAYYLEATGGDPTERAEIRFSDDGFVDVYVGTQSTGQGHETAYVQLTATRLGIDGEKIRIRQGDTDTIPVGGGTGGARSLYSEGQAIVLTTDTIISRGKQAAGEMLEASAADITFAAGRFSIVGTDRGVDILTLAATQRQKAAAGGQATTLDAAEVANIDFHTFPNGCHLAEVEVDPETGVVSVVRYAVFDDVGKAVNPMIVRGQVQGGVAQGTGQALFERTAYDAASGQLLSGSFMDYALPRAGDLPEIYVELVEIPCTTNPLGVKGAGEAGAVGSPPAVINALLDALGGDGVTHIDMPATPETVWKAMTLARVA